MASNIEAAKIAGRKPIEEIALEMGLGSGDFSPYGRYQAKVWPGILTKRRPKGKLVVVTSMTPAPMEPDLAASTTAGLGIALFRLGHRAAVSLKQPSLDHLLHSRTGETDPTYLHLLPAEEILLHLRDIHAVTLAHNLLAAVIDGLLRDGNASSLDPNSIRWNRATEFQDPSLSSVVVGLGRKNGVMPRDTSFETAATSELMAILALATSVADLKERVGRIVVGFTRSGQPVTVDELGCTGTLAALLQEALEPNLIQTRDNSPAFIHSVTPRTTGIGSSSVLADLVALALNDYVVSESPFGTDLGMERFLDIKCRHSGLVPNAIVLNASIRGLRYHGGNAGSSNDRIDKEDVRAVEKGCENLVKHIENARLFGIPVVVALTCHPTDTDRERAYVERISRIAGAEGAFVTDIGARGGAGAISLAEAIVLASRAIPTFKFLYALDLPLKDKVERIAEKIYGATGVDWSERAERELEDLAGLGYGKLPVCMVKTPYSLSHDIRLRGRPRRYRLPVMQLEAHPGAGYVSALCETLGAGPSAPVPPLNPCLDIGENGEIVFSL